VKSLLFCLSEQDNSDVCNENTVGVLQSRTRIFKCHLDALNVLNGLDQMLI